MSKKWLYVFFVLLLVAPLTLAACGGNDEESSGDDQNAAGELSETFESAVGVSFKYPKGWAARDGDSGPELANSEEVLAQMDEEDRDEIPSGAFVLLIFDPAQLAQIAGEQSAKDVLEMFTGFMTDENTTVGEITETKVGENDAARAGLQESQSKSDSFVIVWQDGDTTYLAVGMAREGELDKYEDTAMKILESISYNAPTGDAGGEG